MLLQREPTFDQLFRKNHVAILVVSILILLRIFNLQIKLAFDDNSSEYDVLLTCFKTIVKVENFYFLSSNGQF